MANVRAILSFQEVKANKKSLYQAFFVCRAPVLRPCKPPGGQCGRQLRPGFPAAHRRIRLMLLPSGPDMIHGPQLHRTRPSTLLTDSGPHRFGPWNRNCTLL